MQKWEYLEIHSGYNPKSLLASEWALFVNGQALPNSKKMSFVDYANKLGEDGWELVGSGAQTVLGTGTDYVSHCLYFKRPKE